MSLKGQYDRSKFIIYFGNRFDRFNQFKDENLLNSQFFIIKNKKCNSDSKKKYKLNLN